MQLVLSFSDKYDGRPSQLLFYNEESTSTKIDHGKLHAAAYRLREPCMACLHRKDMYLCVFYRRSSCKTLVKPASPLTL